MAEMNASRSSVQNESKKSENEFNMSETPLSFDESVLKLIDEPFNLNLNALNLRTDAKYKGFDSTMGNNWIYPTNDNYPQRQYQYHISRVSLFKNTLVRKLNFIFIRYPFDIRFINDAFFPSI